MFNGRLDLQIIGLLVVISVFVFDKNDLMNSHEILDIEENIWTNDM